MADKPEYHKIFGEMLAETAEPRENVLTDILSLLEAEAFSSIWENYLQMDGIQELLLPRELEYLRELCEPRKQDPGSLN